MTVPAAQKQVPKYASFPFFLPCLNGISTLVVTKKIFLILLIPPLHVYHLAHKLMIPIFQLLHLIRK